MHPYAIPCPKAPHGELYVMCTDEDWPTVRRETIKRYPELFRNPIVVKRVPVPHRADESSP